MADSNSTLCCALCRKPLPEMIGRGRPRKCCPPCAAEVIKARDRERSRARNPSGLECSIDGCLSPVVAKGWCSVHYTKSRQYGDPLGFRALSRVTKECGWCCKPMSLKPSVAAKQSYCCRQCGQQARVRREGKWVREASFFCKGCAKSVVRNVRSSRDAGEFCSRDCYFELTNRISLERRELRKIASNWRVPEAENHLVALEIQSLRMMAAWTPGNTATVRRCMKCNAKCAGTGERRRTCKRCKDAGKKENAARSRKTEAGKARRRVDKARRRAIERGITADRIDPIKVFERDQWRCHICRCSTPRRLRGTYADSAPELDHVTPLSAGGLHTWGNVKCSCRKCNSIKAGKPMGQLGFDIAA